MALSTEELKGLYVGQTLCLTEIDNRRNNGSINPKEVQVTKIGKKYFYVEDYSKRRFYLENGRHDNGDYLASVELFFDEPTYLAEKEAIEVWGKYRELSNRMYNKPQYLTTEMVQQLIDILTPQQ